jgi:hypothetical protein
MYILRADFSVRYLARCLWKKSVTFMHIWFQDVAARGEDVVAVYVPIQQPVTGITSRVTLLTFHLEVLSWVSNSTFNPGVYPASPAYPNNMYALFYPPWPTFFRVFTNYHSYHLINWDWQVITPPHWFTARGNFSLLLFGLPHCMPLSVFSLSDSAPYPRHWRRGCAIHVHPAR